MFRDILAYTKVCSSISIQFPTNLLCFFLVFPAKKKRIRIIFFASFRPEATKFIQSNSTFQLHFKTRAKQIEFLISRLAVITFRRERRKGDVERERERGKEKNDNCPYSFSITPLEIPTKSLGSHDPNIFQLNQRNLPKLLSMRSEERKKAPRAQIRRRKPVCSDPVYPTQFSCSTNHNF